MRTEDGAIVRPPIADRVDVGLALGLVFAVGIVYAATAARDIVVGDSGDFLTTAATLGVAHPPGYPLLVLLGHVFSWLPVGSLAYRMNLTAVVSGSATVGLTFSICRRLGAPRWAAIVGSLALAFNPLFWEWSLAIEAFALNCFIAAAVVYFLVRWEREPARFGFLASAALCGGLGAANHLTIVFLIPLVGVAMWRRRRFLTAPALAMCTVAIIVGLLPYLYIPWAAARHPFLSWGDVSSAGDLLRHFLRSDYGTGKLVAPGSAPGSPVERLVALGGSFTILEALLAAVGLLEAHRRARWFLWGAGLSFLLAGPAFSAYANIDVSIPQFLWVLGRFFLLPHVIVAPFVALGAIKLTDLATRVIRTERRRSELGFTAGLIALILLPAGLRYRAVDLSQNHVAHTFAEDVLMTLAPNSVLLAPGDEVVFPVAYAQAVEHRRPDVTLVMVGLFRSFEWYIRQLRRRDPGLRIPFDRYDPNDPRATMRALIDANPSRRFAFVGPPADSSLAGAYWLYRRGLVQEVLPMSSDVALQTALQENDRLLRSYRIPAASTIRRNTFEIALLGKYSGAAAGMARQLELAHLDRDATAWYQRALQIDPMDAEHRKALARLTPDGRPARP